MDTRDQDKEQGNDPAEDQGFADVLEVSLLVHHYQQCEALSTS